MKQMRSDFSEMKEMFALLVNNRKPPAAPEAASASDQDDNTPTPKNAKRRQPTKPADDEEGNDELDEVRSTRTVKTAPADEAEGLRLAIMAAPLRGFTSDLVLMTPASWSSTVGQSNQDLKNALEGSFLRHAKQGEWTKEIGEVLVEALIAWATEPSNPDTPQAIIDVMWRLRSHWQGEDPGAIKTAFSALRAEKEAPRYKKFAAELRKATAKKPAAQQEQRTPHRATTAQPPYATPTSTSQRTPGGNSGGGGGGMTVSKAEWSSWTKERQTKFTETRNQLKALMNGH